MSNNNYIKYVGSNEENKVHSIEYKDNLFIRIIKHENNIYIRCRCYFRSR